MTIPNEDPKKEPRFIDEDSIMKLMNIYIKRNLDWDADQDYTNYTLLKGTDFETEEQRAAYFYIKYPPLGYYVDFPNPRWVKIKMLIDPCRGKSNDLCCDGSSESICSDNTKITSGTDIGLAWFVNGFIFKCA